MVAADRYIGIVTLGSFLFGFSLSSMGTVLDPLLMHLNICGDQGIDCDAATKLKVLFTTMVFVTAPIGCVLGGILIDLSRVRTLSYTFILFFLSSCLSAIDDAAFITLGKAIQGVAVGFSTVSCPVLISEFARSEVRGQRGVMHQLMITTGILFGVVPAHFIEEGFPNEFTMGIVKFTFLLPGFISIVALVLIFSSNFESPIILFRNDEKVVAAKMLDAIYPDPKEKEEVNKRLQLDVLTERNEEQKKAVQGKHALRNTLASPVYGMVMMVGMALAIGQQMVGINVFVSMSGELFKAAGLTGNMLRWSSTLMSCVNVIVTLIAAAVVEGAGRRAMLIYGNIGMGICLGIAGVIGHIPGLQHIVPVTASISVIGFIVFFGMTFGPVLWVYLSELFPSEIRGTGMGFCSLLNWVAGAVIVGISMTYNSPENFPLMFSLFAISCFGISAFCFAFVKETAGLDASPYGDISIKSLASFSGQDELPPREFTA